MGAEATPTPGPDGLLYGTTTYGGTGTGCGTYGCGTVFRLSRKGEVTVLHSFERVANDGAQPRAALKLWCDREQTAHLQTALLRVVARAQLRTAQPGASRGTGLGAIAATHGLPN